MTDTTYTAEDAQWDRPLAEADDSYLDVTTAHDEDEENE